MSQYIYDFQIEPVGYNPVQQITHVVTGDNKGIIFHFGTGGANVGCNYSKVRIDVNGINGDLNNHNTIYSNIPSASPIHDDFYALNPDSDSFITNWDCTEIKVECVIDESLFLDQPYSSYIVNLKFNHKYSQQVIIDDEVETTNGNIFYEYKITVERRKTINTEITIPLTYFGTPISYKLTKTDYPLNAYVVGGDLRFNELKIRSLYDASGKIYHNDDDSQNPLQDGDTVPIQYDDLPNDTLRFDFDFLPNEPQQQVEFPIDVDYYQTGSSTPNGFGRIIFKIIVGNGEDDGRMKYFFHEKTGKILVSNIDNKNLLKYSRLPDDLEEYYGDLLLPYEEEGHPTRTFTIENPNQIDSKTINLEYNNALFLFKGRGNLTSPFNPGYNPHLYSKYNRFLHTPYNVYILVNDGGFDETNQKYKPFVEKVFINVFPTDVKSANPQVTDIKDLNYPGTFNIESLPEGNKLVLKIIVKTNYTIDPDPNSNSSHYNSLKLQVFKNNNEIQPLPISEGGNIINFDINFNSDDLVTKYFDLEYTTDGSDPSKATLNIGDKLRFALKANGATSSPLEIEYYELSIYGNPIDGSGEIPLFIKNWNGFERYIDCHPLLNNIELSRPSDYIYYTNYFVPFRDTSIDKVLNHDLGTTITRKTNTLIPYNLPKIMNQTETPADVNKFIYSSIGMSNSRYHGPELDLRQPLADLSASKSLKYYTPIEVRKAYFAYYNSLSDLYPLVNGKVSYNIKYVIGPNGDISSPVMDDYSNMTLLNSLSGKNNEERLRIYVNSNNNEDLKNLNGLINSFEINKKPYPIFYSQKSARDYARNIYINGLRDYLGDQDYYDYSFTAKGNSSESNPEVLTVDQLPINNNIAGLSPDNFNFDLSTTEDNGGISESDIYNSDSGLITIPITDIKGPDGEGPGKPLSDVYGFTVEHSIPTTFLYGIRYRTWQEISRSFWRKRYGWRDAGEVEDVGFYKLYIKGTKVINNIDINNSYSKYNLKNIQVFMDVHYTSSTNSQGYVVQSIDVTSSLVNVMNDENGKSVNIKFNNDDIESILSNASLPIPDNEDNKGLLYMEWRIKCDIDERLFQGMKFVVKTEGKLEPRQEAAIQNPQNYFYPNVGGEIKQHKSTFTLFGSRNPESRSFDIGVDGNFWKFENNGGQIYYDIIYLDVDNASKSYGKGFKQRDIKYEPGVTDAFVGGNEPKFIRFPSILDSWEPKADDEIRFENNEDYVYTIKQVISPLDPDNTSGKLKLVLDRKVEASINKDFFLVRRWKVEKGYVISNQKMPYNSLDLLSEESSTDKPSMLSSNGFLFPEYLSEEINDNPDAILKDLTDKGIIE